LHSKTRKRTGKSSDFTELGNAQRKKDTPAQMGTYLEEAVPPRLFDGYHMDMYEPNFEIKNEIVAPKIDALPPVIESTSAASTYTGNYSAEEAEHLIRCIQAVILSSEPSQGDGLRLPTTVVKGTSLLS